MDRKFFLNLAPERRLAMTFALRQSLEILQMNQLDLGQWLKHEIEKNPLLELDSSRCKKRFDLDVAAPLNLHEHLRAQIRESFPDPEERQTAEICVEFMDDRGFLDWDSMPQKPSEKVLNTLQTFDPPGIFARDLQESMLLQLKARGKSHTLSFELVKHCFHDLLHGRYKAIGKKLNSSDLSEAIEELKKLSLRPTEVFKQEFVASIHPDLRIDKLQSGWTLEVIEDELPKFHIQDKYIDLELESKEERETLRDFRTQAKWISRSLNRRRKLLRELGRLLLCKQAAYLDQKGPLTLLTIRDIAEKLNIHESTLSRALADKYVSTPRGIIPLRSLVSATPTTDAAREILEKLISSEDKQNPLTDEELASELKGKGYSVARRTISKYRSQLKIGSATQRKHRVK